MKKEAKSEALRKKMKEGGKKCKHCGSKKHMSSDCEKKEVEKEEEEGEE